MASVSMRTKFMRRYEAMPELKKAELVEGKVYIMASPVRLTFHARPDFLMQGWLNHYELATPGVEGTSNPKSKLDARNIPQPDSLLRLLPEYGGKSRIDTDGYLSGPPELVVEIAASTRSIDLHEKLMAYQKAGIPEYIVWCTEDEHFKWFHLKDGKYLEMMPDDRGIYRSRGFPGLWLDVNALFIGNMKGVITVLKRGLKSAEHKKFLRQSAHR
jgi:Uma2 family endonuclease